MIYLIKRYSGSYAYFPNLTINTFAHYKEDSQRFTSLKVARLLFSKNNNHINKIYGYFGNKNLTYIEILE